MDDLSLTLYDLCINAIDAKATHIDIELLIDDIKKIISIKIKDNGVGMSNEQIEKTYDPFYTTRTTRRVGLGIPYLKQLTEQCDGLMAITSTPGVGTTLYAELKKDHIDCPPFGDLAETLYMLIIHQNAFDFTFSLGVNQKTIHIKKSEIIEATQGLDLYRGSVKKAIQSYINDSIHQIKGDEDL
ncbi:MAG: ATP-binding protein [Acholeplasmataceae bacterium]